MNEPAPRVALVTGAGRRVGHAIATRLAEAGFELWLHYSASAAATAQLASRLSARHGVRVRTVQADLRDVAAIRDMAAQIDTPLAALVNNAATFAPSPLGSITPESWSAQFDVIARAPLLLVQALKGALERGAGAIVNITDAHVERPLSGHAVYGMAKAALDHMTRVLAVDLGAAGVRVNAVAPGAILWPEPTPSAEERRRTLAEIPLATLGSPGDVAGAVYYLIQGSMTGVTLYVDGGRRLVVGADAGHAGD